MLVGCSGLKPNSESSESIIPDTAEPYSDHSEGIEETVSDDELWEEAVSLIEKRKYPQAISVLSKIEEDDRADDLLQQLRYIISGDYIQNTFTGVAAIDNEGKVIIRDIYERNGFERVQDWTDIKRLSYELDALNSEGASFTTLDDEVVGQRNEQLRRISGISIFATGDSNYAVTDQSGKLYLYNEFSDYLETESAQKEIASWSDIVDIVTGDLRVAVLHKDGTVSFVDRSIPPNHPFVEYSVYYDDMKEWTDIIAISKSSQNILGLKRDGTVVTAGHANEGQKGVAEWTDIVAVSAGQLFHVGLKSDGILVVAGETQSKEPLPDVSDVKNLYVPKLNPNE